MRDFFASRTYPTDSNKFENFVADFSHHNNSEAKGALSRSLSRCLSLYLSLNLPISLNIAISRPLSITFRDTFCHITDTISKARKYAKLSLCFFFLSPSSFRKSPTQPILVDLKFEHAQASASENSPVDEESTFL
jgi:hypothetical protein